MIFEFLKSGLVAFGGCISPVARLRPRYSIIGHWDADHVVVDEEIHIYAPLVPPKRLDDFIASRSFTVMSFKKATPICRMGELTLYARPLGDKVLKEMGISHRFHRRSPSKSTVPIRLIAIGGLKRTEVPETEIMIYIDDYDVDDVDNVMRLVEYHREEFEDRFKGVLLPIYAGTRGHGAKNPQELSELSRDVLTEVAKAVDVVGALIHSPRWCPAWLPEIKAKYNNILEFPRTLKVLEEHPKYRNRHFL